MNKKKNGLNSEIWIYLYITYLYSLINLANIYCISVVIGLVPDAGETRMNSHSFIF